MDDQPVLILGGGINGTAIARELLRRHIPVDLVEANDLGFGATSRSSRLIHGGLRYLEYGEFDLVRESLEERKYLLRAAPHLVRPLRLHIPVASRWTGGLSAVLRFLGRKTRPRARGLWLVRTGLWLYEKYARDPNTRPVVTRRVGQPGAPPLNPSAFRWACAFDDGQVLYPERLGLEWLQDAREQSAKTGVAFRVFNRSTACRDGIDVEIQTSGQETTTRIRPRLIINATGAWVDATLQRMDVASKRLMGGAKGSHLLLANSSLSDVLSDEGVYVEAEDGRPVFILPMREVVLVGTTDIPFDESPESAIADQQEIDYLLQAVRHVFPQVEIQEEDVVAHYAGVRPLPHVDASTPAAVTRRHFLHVHEDAPIPMFSVIGGKLTTCRSLAEEAAEWVCERFGDGGLQVDLEWTATPGGRDYPVPDELPSRLDAIARETGFSRDAVLAVWDLYGVRTRTVLEKIASYGDEARRDLGESLPLPRGLAIFACQEEWANSLSDLVERRLMLVYRRELRRSWLRTLAEILHPDAAEEQRQGEVDCCEHRLRSHYGRKILED